MKKYALLILLILSVAGCSRESSAPVAATETPSSSPACACFSVQVSGHGPAVIFIPGLASSGEVWQDTVDVLKTDYQVHVLTLAGFAGVPVLPAARWSGGYLVTQQHAILEYIQQQQLQQPIIVGHSLGGYLALALAVQAPEQIGGAVNVDGLPALGALFAQSATNNKNQASAAPQGFDPAVLVKSMARDEVWQQKIMADMFRSDGMTSGLAMQELIQADLRAELATLRVPVLTLGALQHGAPYSSPAQVQVNYEQQFLQAPAQFHQFAFAPQSKHFIMADEPAWLLQQLQQFLQRHTVQEVL